LEASGAQALRLIIIGPPASGKGTQARRLADALGLSHLSTGALLREHMSSGTAIGRFAAPILARGAYLPDECMCTMVGEWLGQAGPSWILDGFPRSRVQADFLDQWLRTRGLPLSAVLSLEAPREVLEQRISGRMECPACRWSGGCGELRDGSCPGCGEKAEARQDDTIDNFRNRHQAYLSSALPLIEAYRGGTPLCACDAGGSRDEVTCSLLHQLAAVPTKAD